MPSRLVRAVNAAASTPVLRSDGPPVGGSPLMVGGEQWGEIVDGPVGQAPWTHRSMDARPNRTVCRSGRTGRAVD